MKDNITNIIKYRIEKKLKRNVEFLAVSFGRILFQDSTGQIYCYLDGEVTKCIE